MHAFLKDTDCTSIRQLSKCRIRGIEYRQWSLQENISSVRLITWDTFRRINHPKQVGRYSLILSFSKEPTSVIKKTDWKQYQLATGTW